MLNHKTVKVLHEKRGSKFASNRLWVLLFSMNLLSLISDVLLISPCSVKCVQIVYNNMQFQRQQQLTKYLSRFCEGCFATYFHRAQESLFRSPFYKIDWVYDNFFEKKD